MQRFATKDQILEEAGYYYNFDRALYINRPAKKAFSVEFVEDHTDEDIRARIEDVSNGEGWKFYFNAQPSDYVRRELERLLS